VRQVNAAVLGGIVLDFGDKTIDLSVSSTVNKLNNVLQRQLPRILTYTPAHAMSSRIGLMYTGIICARCHSDRSYPSILSPSTL